MTKPIPSNTELLRQHLSAKIRALPAGFYDSFDYTYLGQNLTHPVTWSLLVNTVSKLPGVRHVGIDCRHNQNGVKFQPDITAWPEDLKTPSLFVDYESPNSSDARVMTKDIEAYRTWCRHTKSTTPYVIVTTLPARPSPRWELRYTGRRQYNYEYREHRKEIMADPRCFWRREYREYTREFPCQGLSILNINGKFLELLYPQQT